jgi:hypothetical protein
MLDHSGYLYSGGSYWVVWTTPESLSFIGLQPQIGTIRASETSSTAESRSADPGWARGIKKEDRLSMD